jgi:hypothetical protein
LFKFKKNPKLKNFRKNHSPKPKTRGKKPAKPEKNRNKQRKLKKKNKGKCQQCYTYALRLTGSGYGISWRKARRIMGL